MTDVKRCSCGGFYMTTGKDIGRCNPCEIARLGEENADLKRWDALREAISAAAQALKEDNARLREAIRDWDDGVIGGDHKLRQIAREGK